MPREVVRSPEHDRNLSLGWLGVAWQEHFCVHGPGDVQGQKVDLDDELAEVTVDTYAQGVDGRRLYDSVFLSRPKGRDKSGHAGRVALFEAFGPCRFKGWATGGEWFRWRDFKYRYTKGEPMGRPIVAPFIRCMATEETQAGNTYDNIYYNLTEGPLSEGLASNAAGLTRTYLPGGGEIVPSTAASASKDGGKETHVVFDETHLYILEMLRKMYATVRRNMGSKRKASEPWSHETSTMYLPGEESVAEQTHKLAELIMEGKTRRSRLLFDHREAPPDVDLTNEAEIRAALAEVYGPFIAVMDVERLISEIWDPRNDPQDTRRYTFNLATSAHDAWLTAPEWKACAAPDKVVADREVITLGFDGSRARARGVTDATALMACRLSDGHLFDPLDTSCVWEQPTGPAGKDWRVPVTLVEAAVEECFRRYTVVAFYADPAKWESHIAEWEAKYVKRLRVRSTRDHPIEWWMTGGRSGLIVKALEMFHSAVVDQGMTHDGSFALTRHVLNARRRPSRSGIQIAKERPESPNKIDAAVAAVLAWQARHDALGKGVSAFPMSVPRRVR